MDWLATTEIAFGRCVDGKENLSKYQSSWFHPPFDDGFEQLRKDPENRAALIRTISISSYQSSIHASSSLNGAGEAIDWSIELHRAAKQNEVADKFDKVSKKLRKGEEVDIIPAIELAKDLANPERMGLVNAQGIDYSSFNELIPSGWDALDYNLGGIPHAAPLVVGGETGIGKSMFSMRLIKQFLQHYPDKVATVYSLEMPAEQYLSRCERVYDMGKMISDGRIFISDKAVTIRDIAVESAAIQNNGIIICDYIDYIVRTRNEEGYTEAYVGSNDICRTLHIPFVMVAQMNRNQYTDPVPRMYHLRWSGMAENVGGGVILLWNPKPGSTEDDYEEHEKNSGFMYVEDSLYLVVWKWRGGWVGVDDKNNLPKDGRARPGPGAIVLPKVKNLWAEEKGRWIVYGQVATSMKKIKRSRG